MARIVVTLVLAALVAAAGCAPTATKKPDAAGPIVFKGDLAFLKKHTDAVVLRSADESAQVIVCPKLQGRVATSTASGADGLSLGWVNREAIASGKNNPHMNAFGGEDRLWLGPEGGQFSIFFKKGAKFDLDHWFTPPPINSEGFDVVGKDVDKVLLHKDMHLENFSGTKFTVEVRRDIHLLSAAEVEKDLGMAPAAGVKTVAYESVNELKNAGKEPWKKDTGLLSIWMLGMFNSSPDTTVVVPFETGPESERGIIVNDTYFGKVPAERLKTADGRLFFKADAKCRSKIGLSKKRAKPVLGSYDAKNHVLTIVQYTLPKDATDYVNSMWEIQKDPFSGDVANSYNDGPSKPGGPQMGQFYELESSSPAAALAPGESLTHVHRTFHFVGTEEDLDKIAKAVLGVGVDEIKKAL
jgi:hypothetical protein